MDIHTAGTIVVVALVVIGVKAREGWLGLIALMLVFPVFGWAATGELILDPLTIIGPILLLGAAGMRRAARFHDPPRPLGTPPVVIERQE